MIGLYFLKINNILYLILILVTFNFNSLHSSEKDLSKLYNTIGNMYAQGRGVPQSYEKAFEYFLKAAVKGDMDAQHNAEVMYQKWKGVSKSYKRTFKWHKEATEEGNIQYRLVIMYEEKDRGIPTGPEKVLELLRKAALEGDIDAQFRLFEASIRGDEKSKNILIDVFEKELEVEGEFENDLLNAVYIRAALTDKNANAQYNLGVLYQKGTKGYSKNDLTAVFFYEMAANQGHVRAQYNLGVMYQKGVEDIINNNELAVYWYNEAAENGDVRAIAKLKEMNEL